MKSQKESNMLLEKISDHYEKVIIDFFEDYEIVQTKKGLEFNNDNDNIIKIHQLCRLLPDDLILNHVETIVLFGKHRKTPTNLLLLIDSYQEKIKENFYIDVYKEYQYYRFDIYHKRYEYKVHSFIDNHDNEDTIRARLDEFIYQDIKLPVSIIKKVFEDIDKSFLDGYDIDLSNYQKEFILASSDEHDFMVVYTNKQSGKQIVVHPLQINEQTGDVFFAGKFENLLRA